MKIEKIHVENITCNGCANSIKRQLSTLEGVTRVDVDIVTGVVVVAHNDIPHYLIAIKLDDLGYPETIKK